MSLRHEILLDLQVFYGLNIPTHKTPQPLAQSLNNEIENEEYKIRSL